MVFVPETPNSVVAVGHGLREVMVLEATMAIVAVAITFAAKAEK
jgi:hypothetical protein